MRSLIIGAAIAALSVSSVLAQTTPPPPPPASGTEQPVQPPPAPPAGRAEQPPAPPAGAEPGAAPETDRGPDGREMRRGERHERGERRQRAGRHGDGPGPHMERRGGQRQGWRDARGGPRSGGPAERGTVIRIEIKGDGAKVEVRCGPGEAARACADISLEILDRLDTD